MDGNATGVRQPARCPPVRRADAAPATRRPSTSARSDRRCPATASARVDTPTPALRAFGAADRAAPPRRAPARTALVEAAGVGSQRGALQKPVELAARFLAQQRRRGRPVASSIERHPQPQQPHPWRQPRAMLVERAAHQAPQEIASGRFACVALGHDKPEPPARRQRPGTVVHSLCAIFWITCGQPGLLDRWRAPARRIRPAAQKVGREMSAASSRRRCKHRLEVDRVPHAAEHRHRDAAPALSDRQALAALGAASVEHGPTAPALHANEEAVRTGAADLGRLIGAFHLHAPSGANNGARATLRRKKVTNCAARRSGVAPVKTAPRLALRAPDRAPVPTTPQPVRETAD